jgi:hypothetical protein
MIKYLFNMVNDVKDDGDGVERDGGSGRKRA